MKPAMKCKLNKFLFRLLPIPAWQAYLLDKHFSRCPLCREQITTDEQLKELLVSPEKAERLPGLWLYVNKHMEEPADHPTRKLVPERLFKGKINSGIFPGWQWKTAVVGLVLALAIVFLPFSLKKNSTGETHHTEINGADQVVVKSVKIGSEAAKFYFFESKDPDKLIVWTQRNQKNGG